jgi:polysaccharide biosynthesis protein PslG
VIRPALALVIAAAVALLLVLDASRSSQPQPSSTPEGGQAQIPRSPQAPPWGFVGNWQDYCYRTLSRPPGYAAEPVMKGERCPGGSARFGAVQQIELTARAGATIARLGLFWGAVEPKPPVTRGGRRIHVYNWEPVMRAYRAMLSAGIQPVVLATGTPEWARQRGWKRPGACRARHGKDCSYPPSRPHLSDWRAFIQALTRRLPQMLALEVWNEPNLPRFFAPRPSPARYSRLLGAADQAARLSGNPVTIVTGGLTASASQVRRGIAAPRFLARIYQLTGKAPFDGIGAHPYPEGRPWVESMAANLDQLRRVRDRFGDRATPLWITEVGVGGTSAGPGEASVGLARQGPVLARMYRSAQRSDVRALIFYALRDSPVEGPKFEPFGVVRADLRPKPAYCYLASHLGGVRACGGDG